MNGKKLGGRYKLIEKIGSGGMADVYLATDETLGRKVAIKLLHPQYAHEENFIARFRREAQSAANLSHPNIVSVYDWGAEGSTYYLVMEHLTGRTLKELINESAPLSETTIVDIGRKIASALAFAHRNGIVHRDIKPQNIIITGDNAVKVTDFGIARSISSTMTQTGSIMGTAQYLSPEQAQGGSVSSASDIYSLGIVLYEMATGRVPFTGDSAVAVALKHVHEAPKPPRELNPELSVPLNSAILRAIAKHPSDRYASAEELDQDLLRCSQGLPVAHVQPGGEETVIIPRPRLPLPEEAAPPRRPVRPERKGRWQIPVLIGAILLALAAIGLLFYFSYGKVEMTKVPSLTGKSLTQARTLIKKAKLKLVVTGKVYDSSAPDTVVSQVPAPAEEVAVQSKINVQVSRGPRRFTVPGVVNRTLDQATFALARADLEVGNITRPYSSQAESGLVMSQSPEPGAQVDRGTPVDMVVSNGPAPIHVPDLQGKTEAEAGAALSELGLSLAKTEEFSDSVEAGHVIRSVPSAGVTIEPGATVSVVISKGPELVTVPDVVGLSESDAKSKLSASGFAVAVKSGISSPSEFGKVVNQDPVAGSKVKKDITVTIWVGEKPPKP